MKQKNPRVTIVTPDGEALSLVIPKGEKGDPGKDAVGPFSHVDVNKFEDSVKTIEKLTETLDVQDMAENSVMVIKGARGLKGDKGDKGDDGVDGKTGPKGDRGERGPQGEKGEPGRDGIDGKDGKDGKNGKDGKPGRDGKDASIELLDRVDKKLKESESNLLWVNNGAVKSLRAGSLINIDNTDPQNPIISSTGDGTGTVQNVSVVTANGVSGSVASPTVNPAITLTLGNITPSKVDIGTPDTMVVHGTTVTHQAAVNSDTQAVIESHTHSNTAASGAVVYGARSRGTTASPTVVQSGDAIYQQYAVGYDGTDYELVGYTAWEVDGTPGNNDMPGRYVIYVTPDGGFTPAEALRISNDKKVTLADGLLVTTGIDVANTDTTITRSSAGVIAVEGVVIPSISSTNTLTNKRITNRITTITSSATPTINTDDCDAVTITALATAITSMTTNLSGTPTNFQRLRIRIKDDGTARAITWGASFTSYGPIIPTTTTAGKILSLVFEYDTVAAVWGCVSAQEQP